MHIFSREKGQQTNDLPGSKKAEYRVVDGEFTKDREKEHLLKNRKGMKRERYNSEPAGVSNPGHFVAAILTDDTTGYESSYVETERRIREKKTRGAQNGPLFRHLSYPVDVSVQSSLPKEIDDDILVKVGKELQIEEDEEESEDVADDDDDVFLNLSRC